MRNDLQLPAIILLLVAAVVGVCLSATSHNSSQAQNNTIRDETASSANTALRVGNALNGILEASTLELSAQSVDFTAVAGFAYLVDSSVAAVTVTAPTLPDIDDMFSVGDPLGQWATNNVTVDFGTLPLHNQATPNNLYVGNGSYSSRTFRYDGIRWVIFK